VSKKQKLITKLLSANSDFKWTDLVALMTLLGFTKIEGGGSRVKFELNGLIINLHRPHPRKEIKAYAVRQVRDKLIDNGML